MVNETRGTISTQLLDAKRAAVAQFLTTEMAPVVFAAAAASTKPQHVVWGVGIGPKITDGKPTGKQVVRFYVERKLPKDVIPKEFLLPEKVDNVETDVIETLRFRLTRDQHAGPAAATAAGQTGGCSVGFQFSGSMAGFVMAGTLGAEVQVERSRFILSNNHVLANENALPVGSPIFQPACWTTATRCRTRLRD